MSDPPIPTVADLKKIFAERGVRLSRARGQNFLVDPGIMRFIVRAANLDRMDVVLEPGAGTGGLTGLLSAHAATVVAVEVDRKLHAIAAERLAGLPNVQLIHSDIMGPGETIALKVSEALRAALAAVPEARLKLVANLPYRISTALMAAMLGEGPIPQEMLVTVQREVADRVCAKAGPRDYGYLSVLVQAVAHTERVRRLSPKVFWPQPGVESCILRIRPDPKLRAAAGDLQLLHRVASGLFRHRRKQAARALTTAGLVNTREEAQRLLSAVGVAETVRAEDIEVRGFIELARRLGQDTQERPD